MHRIIPNQRFGRLTVIEEVTIYYPRKNGKNPRAHRYASCRCDCGKFINRSLQKLLSSNDHSSCNDCSIRATKHGKHKTEEYSSWQHMKSRCYDKNNKKYSLYGGRGIKVCKEWKDDFESFLKDMGTKPSKKYTIDRINPDGDYEPSNCRWATSVEQNRNLRTVHYITYKNITNPVTVWAEMANKDPSTLRRKSNAHRTDEILSKWLPTFAGQTES